MKMQFDGKKWQIFGCIVEQDDQGQWQYRGWDVPPVPVACELEGLYTNPPYDRNTATEEGGKDVNGFCPPIESRELVLHTYAAIRLFREGRLTVDHLELAIAGIVEATWKELTRRHEAIVFKNVMFATPNGQEPFTIKVIDAPYPA